MRDDATLFANSHMKSITFVGIKMLVAPWVHVPVQASLAIVAVPTGASVIASLIATRRPQL